jgi:FixJ family two-component response regulator
MKKSAQVVLLGSEFDALTAAELIPLLKQRNRNLPIILVSADASLPLIRKVRSEGIFYHALKPVDREDKEVIRRAVECAFEHLRQHKFHQAGLREKLLNNIIKKENARKGTRIILRTLAMLLVAVPNAFAATTAGSTAAVHWCSLLLAFLPWSLSSS